MEYSVGVTESNALGSALRESHGTYIQQLVGEVLDRVKGQRSAISVRVHVALEILLTVFENEHELGLGVDDVVEADNVDVLQLYLLACHFRTN